MVYNGEIYNFQKVRAALEQRGHIFKTQTDTEIIVHAYEAYGDARERRLCLARDRLGIKPLYYWSGADTLVFGSELEVLILQQDVPRQVNLAALNLFLTLEYIPAPLTIYGGVFKLLPGH